MTEMKFQDLSKDRQILVDAAGNALQTSYSPYSRFRVGAALLTEGGDVITASNVENASYGLTICAETAAVARANAQGHRTFTAIAVIASPEDGSIEDIISPCGRCRQVLFEMTRIAGKDMDVILADPFKRRVVLTTVRELLPMGFAPVGLEKKG